MPVVPSTQRSRLRARRERDAAMVQRINRAMELHIKGHTLEEIGATVAAGEGRLTPYGKATVHRWISEGLRMIPAENVEQARKTQLARFDADQARTERLLDKWMPLAMGEALVPNPLTGELEPMDLPSVEAAKTVVAVLGSRVKIAAERHRWAGIAAADIPVNPAALSADEVDKAIVDATERLTAMLERMPVGPSPIS